MHREKSEVKRSVTKARGSGDRGYPNAPVYSVIWEIARWR
jgi:hypothetical protein